MFIPIKTALHEETQRSSRPEALQRLDIWQVQKACTHILRGCKSDRITWCRSWRLQPRYSCEIISVFFESLRCTNGPISHNIHNSQLPYLTINHATTCPVEICHSQLPQNQPPRRSQRRPPQRLPTNLRSSSKLSKGRNLRIFAPKSKPSQEDHFIFHLFDFQNRKCEF